VHLPIEQVRKLFPQNLLLYGLLHKYGFNVSTIDDIISALDKHSGRIFESTGFKLILDREKLILSNKQQRLNNPVQVKENLREVNYNNYLLRVLHDDSALIVRDNPLAVSVDADLLIYPLTLRHWQQGDHFYPLGMKNRQKLSDFFIHQKIPLHEKTLIPVLVNGNGEIIWIGGYRGDERYKVSKKTKKVTIFELYKI
jgi:tRNA(Ile)-lysidine synthase